MYTCIHTHVHTQAHTHVHVHARTCTYCGCVDCEVIHHVLMTLVVFLAV